MIVVAGRSWSTYHGRNAYVHDHAMNNVVTIESAILHLGANAPSVNSKIKKIEKD